MPFFPPQDGKVTPVKVGLDYDNTITLDPDTWSCIIRIMQLAGWEICVTTWRPLEERAEVDQFVSSLPIPIPVIYCNGVAKRTLFDADIWIDDKPASVLFSLTRPATLAYDREPTEELVLPGTNIGIQANLLLN